MGVGLIGDNFGRVCGGDGITGGAGGCADVDGCANGGCGSDGITGGAGGCADVDGCANGDCGGGGGLLYGVVRILFPVKTQLNINYFFWF
jgi:hypothetical protein